jgi:hypothetical protein
VKFGLKESEERACLHFSLSPFSLLFVAAQIFSEKEWVRFSHLAGKQGKESESERNGEHGNQRDGPAQVDRQHIRSS